MVATIDDSCFESPEGIAIANGKAYVANRNGDSVCVVDVASRSVTTSVAAVGEPRFAVATPDGAFVYVSVPSAGSNVLKIRTSDDTVVATIPIFARNLAVSPDSSKIYVGTQGADIGVIDVASDAVSTITVPGAFSIYGVAITSDGALGLATDEDRDVAYLFDPASDTVILNGSAPVEIPTGSTPRAVGAT